MLIDRACGISPSRPKAVTKNQKNAAALVAVEVLHHIDTMYPGMWVNVPKCARTSVRNKIRQQVIIALVELST